MFVLFRGGADVQDLGFFHEGADHECLKALLHLV